jgi:hypothetical protein
MYAKSLLLPSFPTRRGPAVDRVLSGTVQLSDPDAYAGGALQVG